MLIDEVVELCKYSLFGFCLPCSYGKISKLSLEKLLQLFLIDFVSTRMCHTKQCDTLLNIDSLFSHTVLEPLDSNGKIILVMWA